jgi:hypothetical protein
MLIKWRWQEEGPEHAALRKVDTSAHRVATLLGFKPCSGKGLIFSNGGGALQHPSNNGNCQGHPQKEFEGYARQAAARNGRTWLRQGGLRSSRHSVSAKQAVEVGRARAGPKNRPAAKHGWGRWVESVRQQNAECW